jgi:DUF1365 family protein
MAFIYKNYILHERILPKKYIFGFKFFWYFFDLDELEETSKKSKFFSYNSFNLFSFYDKDHLNRNNKTSKENVIDFLKENEELGEVKRINIITNLRFLGYIFNPVSYFFIEMVGGQEHCIIEIGNTYKEIKPYFVSNKHLKNNLFDVTTPKKFYISPFSELDNTMRFIISRPSEEINVNILDYQVKGDLELKANLKGIRQEFSDLGLIKAALLKPFATLQIIIAIHIHALRIFLKKIPYFSKDKDQHLQQGFYSWK